MKNALRSSLRVLMSALIPLIVPVPLAQAAESAVNFGLVNRSILGATLLPDAESDILRVSNLSSLGYQGISVQLGEADAGFAFTPYKEQSLQDGQFMAGHAYGLVGGVNRRVSSVYCRREAYATYPFAVDLLPLGSPLVTIEVYSGQILVARKRHTPGKITISTDSYGYTGARVNPFWRMPDGGVGVLLESPYSSIDAYLPDDRRVVGSRIFFRAETPLFNVRHLSRVDIFAGGPDIAEFVASDERPGFFGRLHRGLGDVIFKARDSRLKLDGLGGDSDSGVLIETGDTPSFEAHFLPAALTTNGAAVEVSATGTRYNFLGPVKLVRQEGTNQLRITLDSLLGAGRRIEAFLQGVAQGVAQEDGQRSLTVSMGTNVVSLVSAGVRGGTELHGAALVFKFAAPETLTFGGRTLTGDEIHFSVAEPQRDVGTFSTFQIIAQRMAPMTIIREDAAPAPSVQLAITKRGSDVVLSWPDVAPTTYLTRLPSVDVPGSLEFASESVNRSRREVTLPASGEYEFFRLTDIFATNIDE